MVYGLIIILDELSQKEKKLLINQMLRFDIMTLLLVYTSYYGTLQAFF
jgi:hypothetical protein